MKYSRYLLLLMALPIALHAGNILSNAGFESGAIGPWFNSNDFCSGCTWSATNSDSHSGAFSATVSGNRLLEQDFSAVAVSLITNVSFWARHPNSANGAAMAVYFLYSDSSHSEFIVNTTSSNWQQFDVTSDLAAGKSLAGWGVYGNSGALARLDDAQILANVAGVPEPGTLALLAGGLFAIAAVRRRQIR